MQQPDLPDPPDSPDTPDLLELTGLGGLYNGARYTVAAGTSASAGGSSLATCPVTRCRNYARLEGRALRAELVGALAAEHVRWIYLGGKRLIVENLAGRDVTVGGAKLPDRVEVDLGAGPVEVRFGLGERIVASLVGDDRPPQRRTPAAEAIPRSLPFDPLAATLTWHGEVPRQEELDPPLRLYPPPVPEREPGGREAGPTGPGPRRDAPGPIAEQPRARRRRAGSSGAIFFSVLLHLVVILGLFSYIASGIVTPRGSTVTDVSVVTPTSLPTAAPVTRPRQKPVPSDAPMAESELPAVVENEVAPEFRDGPGVDEATEAGLPGGAAGGAGGEIGLGPGGRLGGGYNGGGGGGRPPPPATGKEGPIRLALDWLRRHQDEDGSWGGVSSLKNCTVCVGSAKRQYRIAETGLALLAFAGAGNTHREGEFQDTVRTATKLLMDRCAPDGSFHPEMPPDGDRRMYGQAMAVLSLSEVYRQSGSPFLKRVIERGVRFIERAQEPYAGWRYQADGRGSDTSVTGWQVLALHAATNAGIPVNPATRSGARQWLAAMTENQTWRVGYNRRGRGSLAMTATGLTLNLLLGRPASDPAMKGGFRILAANPPTWPLPGSPPLEGNPPDLYYWYFGTLASARRHGTDWAPWRKALRTALLAHQEAASEAAGSWSPPGKWEEIGGRVMATSLGALCLELADGLKTAFK